MISKRNLDLRQAKGKIPVWVIAERLGIHEKTLYGWLRKELSKSKKDEIIAIIEDLKKEMTAVV